MFIALFGRVYICRCTCYNVHDEDRRQLSGVLSFLHVCAQGLIWSIWWQVPLPAEPPVWILIIMVLTNPRHVLSMQHIFMTSF